MRSLQASSSFTLRGAPTESESEAQQEQELRGLGGHQAKLRGDAAVAAGGAVAGGPGYLSHHPGEGEGKKGGGRGDVCFRPFLVEAKKESPDSYRLSIGVLTSKEGKVICEKWQGGGHAVGGAI